MGLATEQELEEVRIALGAIVGSLHPLAAGMLPEQDYFLTRLLLAAARFGPDEQGEAVAASAEALELLDLSLRLSQDLHAGDADFSDVRLMVADHLFAHALDRVITLDKPRVIDILATAIAETATARTVLAKPGPRMRLIVAAIELAVLCSGCKPAVAQGLRDVAKALSEGPAAELTSVLSELPGGPPLTRLREVLASGQKSA